MPVNVIMPQMGESIAEGTIVRWFKQEGESVTKDEPLLEISTDKVDAEVPAPASGTLAKILHGPGETVAVETVIGHIAGEGEDTAPPPAKPEKKEEKDSPGGGPQEQETAGKPESKPPAASKEAPPAPTPEKPQEPADEDEAALLRRRSTPLVRRIAAEHNLDLAEVSGTGSHGRVTKDDILAYLEQRKATPPREAAPPRPDTPAVPPAPRPAFAGDSRREPLSIMRQRIAEHMVASRRTSPHVHTVFEADMSTIVALREAHKKAFEEQYGLKLTFTSFFLAAVVAGLKEFPEANASLDGTDVVFHRHVNLGVAVALSNGLIVPVIKQAEELSLVGLQRAVADLAHRARHKQLKPEDVQGSTFSVTNPGPYGGLYGLPIINQPNVAILSTGGIQRRPVVVTDPAGREAIAIRDMVYLALSFDHRLVDGAMADQFMARVKRELEQGSFALS